MKELIKIQENENLGQAVSARELYDFLEGKERFSKWFERMVDYGFIENIDYTPYQMVHPQNNQYLDDYALTLDTAKEIAMIQKSPKGREARRYFIECEHIAKAAHNASSLFTLHYGCVYTSNRRLAKLTGIDLGLINSVLKDYLKGYIRFEEIGSKKIFNEGVMVPDVKYNGYDLSATENQIMDQFGCRYIAPARDSRRTFIMNNFVCYSGFDSSRESKGLGSRECYMTSEGLKDFLNFYSKKMNYSGLLEFKDIINNQILLAEHQLVKINLSLEIPKEHWISTNGVHLDKDGNFNKEQHCHYFFSRKCFYFRNFNYWYQVYLNYCKDNDIKIPLSEKKVEAIYNKYKVRFSSK